MASTGQQTERSAEAQAILAIVAQETGIERSRLRPEATLGDLGIPSIDLIQAIFALENHFDIEIPVVAERSGAEFATVRDLVDHVLATLDRAQAGA